MPEETTRAYRTIVAGFADAPDLAEEAAMRLAGAAAGTNASPDRQIEALQPLRADDLGGVRAAAGLLEGRLTASIGNLKRAKELLAQVAAMAKPEPRLAARAAFELGGLHAQLGEYQKAIDVYESIASSLRDRIFGGAPSLYRQAKQSRIDEYLAKGNYELQVGDSRLALATFSELAALEPDSVEAWRGVVEAQWRCGLLDSKGLDAYRQKAGKAPASALAQYTYGLALTYTLPIPDLAMNRLQRAVLLDGSVPYFYQTLGFVYEHYGRLRNSPSDRAAALHCYERAMALLTSGGRLRTTDYARLLINCGNAALAVGSSQRAADLYERRIDFGLPFDSPANEFLTYRSAGIALFRASRPDEAVRRFNQALEFLPHLPAGLVSTGTAEAIGKELRDRTALALWNAGRYAEAAALFAEVAHTARPRSLSLVRAMRSRGFALHRLAQQQSGLARGESLTEAAAALRDALAVLDAGIAVENEESKPSKGLLQVDVAISADQDSGGAMLGFTPAQERRLILAALSRVLEELGDTTAAVRILREQLSVPVPSRDENVAYHNTVRQVTLDRLANDVRLIGRDREAAEVLLDAVATARYKARGEEHINGNALSLALGRLAELALGTGNPPFTAKELGKTWLFATLGSGTGPAPAVTLECLEAGIGRALELRDQKTDEHILQYGVQRARLQLARALLMERMAEPAPGDPLASLASAALAARAERLAATVAADADAALEGGEMKRLALFAHALLIRQSIRLGDAAAEKTRLAAALEAADRYGFPAFRWWLTAQGALAAKAPARYADAALDELEKLIPASADRETRIPFDLLRHCELAAVSDRFARGDMEGAWSLTERWRVARLRLMLSDANPGPRSGDADDAGWLAATVELRADVQRLAGQVRGRPASDTPQTELDALRQSQERLRLHLESGRAMRFPGALLLAAHATPFEDAAVLLESNQRFPGGTALVLASAGQTVAWTNGGLLKVDSPAAWAQLRAAAKTWFVLGDRLPADASKDALVVNMLTFETTFARAEEPRLSVATGVAEWPGAERAPLRFLGALQETLAGADGVRLTAPLAAEGWDPTGWKVRGTGIMMGQVMETLPALGEVGVSLEPGDPASIAGGAALEENLAAVLAATGAATVRINGRIWLAPPFSIASAPDLAETWLAADSGRVKAYLDQGDNVHALAPLRRVLLIREALGKPAGEIAEAANLLARVEGRVGHWEQAAAAAGKATDLVRRSGDSGSLAKELSLLGSFLNDARRFEDARKAYAEAASVYQGTGDAGRHAEMLARSGVALENGGRYGEALAIFKEAEAAARAAGDKALTVRQLRRQGRIYLQRQNRYAEAEAAFTAARDTAEAAGIREDALLSALDVARVRERVGAYAEAIDISSKVAGKAGELGLRQLQADALLVRAYVEWASASYLNAFKSQREAMLIAEDLDDTPLLIIGHNTAGLIGWALNDTGAALKEFDSAVTLARTGLFSAEVASSLNNRGLVYRTRAEFDRALTEFGDALKIDREESNAWGIAYSQRNIGLTHIQRGRPLDSIPALEEAVRLATAIGDRANRAKSLVAMGDAYRGLDRPVEANLHYRSALNESVAIPLPEMQWRALYGLALLASAGKDTDEAQKRFAAAIEVVERLRASIRIEELQDGFLLDKQSLYGEMITFLLDQGEPVRAFEYSERSRGRNFIDMLGSQKVNPASGADRVALEREAKLRSDVESLERKLAGAAPADRPGIEPELAEARSRYSRFLLDLRANNPQLSSFVAVPTLDLPTLQKLLDAETKMVVYHVLPEEVVAWVIGKSSFNVVRTPVKHTELSNLLGAFRRRIQRFDDVSAEETMLSELLMAPIQPLLVGAKRVGIVPHRELHQMPFAAMRLGSGYIIDQYALFYAPSASVVQYTFSRRRDARNDKVLAIGNPRLANESLDLPFAEKEANRMKWTFPNATVVTGTEATESWVSKNIGEFGIVHIASHGEYNEQAPLLSAVKLSADSTNDGDLTTREIFGLSINADLIALSACQTGLGRVGNGDDIVGLNRAFVYAGTHEILSSLWRVDDVATAVLIKHFYRNLDGRDRAEALRQAQLEVRRQYSHPAYWAAIFLSGDWQ